MCMYLTMWLQTIIRCFAISACWMLVCICTHTMPCEVWSNNNQMIQSSFYLVSCIAVVINSWHEVVHFSLKWNVRNNICSVMCDEWYSVICNWQWVISDRPSLTLPSSWCKTVKRDLYGCKQVEQTAIS